MQERHLEVFEGYVPFTGGRYFLSHKGVVTDQKMSCVVEPTYSLLGEPIVVLNDGLGDYSIKVAVILAIMAKRSRIPYRLWGQLDVLYVDSNPKNFHPVNTVWKYPVGGLRFNETEFCFIPGFSRYLIDRQGVIYSLSSKKNLAPYSDELGYLMYGLTPDIGKRTIMGMHRALALAHIPYPATVDKLDVNHLNGVKSDNGLANLEWAKRKRNCDHAYSTGLRTDNIEVDVRNAFNGEERTFYSTEEAARQLKLGGETVRLRLKSQGRKVYPPGLQFKAAKDKTPWTEFKVPLQEVISSRSPLTFTLTNLATNAQHRDLSTGEVAAKLSLTQGAVSFHLSTMAHSKIVRGFLLEYSDFELLAKSSLAEMPEENLF